MAGIGFELKKLFKENKLSSLFQVYGYAAVLSSGTFIISIFSVLFIGLIKIYENKSLDYVIQFQVSVTYLLSLSLIFSSLFQLSYSRYVSDRIFNNEEFKILPSYLGAISVSAIIGFPLIMIFNIFFLKNVNSLFVIIFSSTFLVLNGMWIANTLLLGIKKYKYLILSFVISYLVIIILSSIIGHNLEGLIISFFIGNTILFFMLSYIIIKNYKSNELILFDSLTNKNERLIPSLILASLFYNTGIWIDKFLFWFSKDTGYNVLSNIKASIIYDPPIFLAYLSIIPAMAIFFYRLEADFAQKYEIYYQLIREGGLLREIRDVNQKMVDTVRIMIREALIIQGIFNLLIYFYSPWLFDSLKIPKLYLPIFYIDLFGVQLQFGFMAMLSVLHYMDKRKQAMYLSFIFLFTNFLFTFITINFLGPYYFGYGFAISSFISFILSLMFVRKTFKDLEYETFMLS